MSRQIQIRRGTAAEHENFIGAMGEITMDTDAKTLRVHDGETPGGLPLAHATTAGNGVPDGADYVVEYSAPGANPNWRKYKSGWCEIFGTITANGNIVFPFAFSDKNNIRLSLSSVGGGNGIPRAISITETGFQYASANEVNTPAHWCAFGILA